MDKSGGHSLDLINIPLPQDFHLPAPYITHLHLALPPPPPPPPTIPSLTMDNSYRNGPATTGESETRKKKVKLADSACRKDNLLPPPPPPLKTPYARQIFIAPPKINPSKDKDKDSGQAAALKVFHRDTKKFESTIAEVFNSRKPHSASKVHAVAEAATKQSVLYKVVERSLALLVDKMLMQQNFEGFRTCFFMMDGVISAAQKKFQSKEKFSGRLQPMIITRLTQFINLHIDASSGQTLNHESRRQASSLHKIKRECLRIVSKWLDKKRFSDARELQRLYTEWSAHFPELAALKTSANTPSNKLLKLKSTKSSSLPLPLQGFSTVASKDTSQVQSSTGLLTSSRAAMFQSLGDSSAPGMVSDLESRLRDLVGSGRLPSLLTNVPSNSKTTSLALSPLPPVPLPQLPVYPCNAVPNIGKCTDAPKITAASHRLRTGRITAESPAIQLAASNSADQESVKPDEVLRSSLPLRKVDSFEYLARWRGFVPKSRPNHFTVVTCLLHLSNLPKEEDEGSLEATVKRLFGHFGTVIRVSLNMKQRSVIIQMENRCQALRAKRAIVDPQNSSNGPITHDEKELILLNSARSNKFQKVKLEWYPNRPLKTTYLKCWENIPHGVAYIPYQVCHTDTLTQFRCNSEFDIDKFKTFAREIVGEKEAIIVPETIAVEVRDSYHKITEALFAGPPDGRKRKVNDLN